MSNVRGGVGGVKERVQLRLSGGSRGRPPCAEEDVRTQVVDLAESELLRSGQRL